MDAKLIWLTGFVGVYWAYCLFWGFKGARDAKTSADYFLAGRSIGVWVFVLAATATSFSGWTFVGHPGKIFTDGLPYAFASFYALTIRSPVFCSSGDSGCWAKFTVISPREKCTATIMVVMPCDF